MRANDFYDNDAYVVHTQMLRVVDHPFNPTSDLREVWELIFKDTNCFSNVRARYRGYDPRYRKGPSFTFVRNMGPICFNLRNARLESPSVVKPYLGPTPYLVGPTTMCRVCSSMFSALKASHS